MKFIIHLFFVLFVFLLVLAVRVDVLADVLADARRPLASSIAHRLHARARRRLRRRIRTLHALTITRVGHRVDRRALSVVHVVIAVTMLCVHARELTARAPRTAPRRARATHHRSRRPAPRVPRRHRAPARPSRRARRHHRQRHDDASESRNAAHRAARSLSLANARCSTRERSHASRSRACAGSPRAAPRGAVASARESRDVVVAQPWCYALVSSTPRAMR
mmetsp:Transcript_6431/g.21042  ORF Transcript_6431/g.21042 Transcript_6431/m.21042 type:complete len:222 (-) Transcript_6431:6807-7472(-)